MRILPLLFVATLVLAQAAGCSSTQGLGDAGGTAGTSASTGGTGGAATGTGGTGTGGTGTGGTGTGGTAGGSGGRGGHGGHGAQGGQGGLGAGGGMTCSPVCGNRSICVATGTEGGALIMPNDAGVCPSGRHLNGQTCVSDLSYVCMTIPAGCAGTVTCACASSLCSTLHTCEEPSGGILSCIEAVP